MVTELNDKNFKKTINSNIPIIVDFWATWCGPCQMLTPVFEQLSKAQEFEGKLKFAKLSTEDYSDVAETQHITGIPCLIVFKNGEEVDRIIGFYPAPALKRKIESVLGEI
jgi:thioredoxin